jgi:hypothetical protein
MCIIFVSAVPDFFIADSEDNIHHAVVEGVCAGLSLAQFSIRCFCVESSVGTQKGTCKIVYDLIGYTSTFIPTFMFKTNIKTSLQEKYALSIEDLTLMTVTYV